MLPSRRLTGRLGAWTGPGGACPGRGGQDPRADRRRSEQPQLARHDPADEGRPRAFGPVHRRRGDHARAQGPAIGLGRVPPRFLQVRRGAQQLQRRARGPPEVRKSLEEYVAKGGGLAIIHAANNAFRGLARLQRDDRPGLAKSQFRRPADDRRQRQGRSHPQGPGAGHRGTARRMPSKSWSAMPTIRSPAACPRSGCTPRTSFTTASADRRSTWRSSPRPIPTRPRGEPAPTSR